jgi:hypothetical protein
MESPNPVKSAESPLHTQNIGNPKSCQFIPERRICAIACIGQQDPGIDARSFRVPDLLERDLRLGFKNKVLRNARLRAALCITGPDLWHIKPICDR